MTAEEAIQTAFETCFFDWVQSEEFKQSANDTMHKAVISDLRQKLLVPMANRQDDFDDYDTQYLSYLRKQFGDVDESESEPDEDWSDDMIQEYADNLRNYLYTYKESATKIDPSIDPEEPHRGPMAQDIEKVAPDCIKETPEGVKTVDGNRLALVNAGVIGDLARRLIELEDKVYGTNK